MDYFNEQEREKQKKFSAWRDRFFTPIVQMFIAAGLSPNAVTALGILWLVIAALLPGEYLPLIALLVVAYVLFDGIDGPLARATSRAHPGGSLVDIVADQLGVVVLPAAATFHYGADGASAVAFSTGYVIFIAFAVLTNEMKVAIPPYVRIKYFFYGVYALGFIGYGMVVSGFMAIFGIYYWVMSFIALHRIHMHYDELHAQTRVDDRK